LACCDKSMAIDDILNKVADFFDGKIVQDSVEWALEMRKLRFCVLTYLKKHISDERELLDKIAQVYDDFGFPKDMENFIYYMPSKRLESLQLSPVQAVYRLIGLFESFLGDEKKFLIESK